MTQKSERYSSRVQQYLGLWPMGVEDVGVVGAVHHLAAVLLVFGAAAAVGALGLGSMAISSHPVTSVSHDNSLFMVLLERKQRLLFFGVHTFFIVM